LEVEEDVAFDDESNENSLFQKGHHSPQWPQFIIIMNNHSNMAINMKIGSTNHRTTYKNNNL
jgi:hypothetical protein